MFQITERLTPSCALKIARSTSFTGMRKAPMLTLMIREAPQSAASNAMIQAL
jgi:hypothetical protein